MNIAEQFRTIDSTMPNGAYVTFRRLISPDETAKPTDFECYDADQIEAYSRGDWCFVGVQAAALMTIVTDGCARIYKLTSPGLWAIESDSGEEYLNDVFREETALLSPTSRRSATCRS